MLSTIEDRFRPGWLEYPTHRYHLRAADGGDAIPEHAKGFRQGAAAHQAPRRNSAVRVDDAPSPRDSSPLADLLVLDVTRVLAGPYATMVLADLGAEVIKIERPLQGDDARAFGPFSNGSSGYFASVNRGKKSVTLDLRTDGGREAFRGLAAQADVLVENFRPGVMDRLGFGYDAVRDLNPRLVYASCSGFGQTGPYSRRPAYDIVVQAIGGLLGITGEEDGGPVRVGVSLGDLSAALFLVVGILSALVERTKTGRGQRVDVAMLDSVVALLENAIVRNDLEPEAPGRLGTRHPSIAPFQAFATRDGHLVVAAGNDDLWGRICAALDANDLTGDPCFFSNHDRVENHAALERALAPIFASRSTGEWLERLEAGGVPCGPVNGVDQVVHHPQVQARDMLMTVADADGNSFRVAANPVKLSEQGVRPRDWVATLGEHTREVLTQRLGMSGDTVEALLTQASDYQAVEE